MKELLNGKLMEEALGKLRGLHPELEEGLAQIHMALHDPYGYVCQLEATWRLEETEDGCPDITDRHILEFAEMLYSQEFISGETSYELSSQFQDHLIHEDRKGRILYRVQELLGDQFSVSIHVETVCLLSNRKCAGNEPKSELASDLGECRDTAESVKGFLRKPDTHVDLTLDMEDYYRIKDQEKQSNK